jgi:apolipoprotein N-acyltransferase
MGWLERTFGSGSEGAALEDSILMSYIPGAMRRWLPLLGALLGGWMLGVSYPPYSRATLAFGALVPLMYAVHAARLRRSVWLGWLFGWVYFLVSLSWLLRMMLTVDSMLHKAACVVAYLLLSLLCGAFCIPTALMTTVCVKRWGVNRIWHNARTMVLVSATWVALEYLRSFLFTGFPWNFLGTSQYQNLTIIQVADWGGAYAVSAILVFLNAGIFVTFMQYTHGGRTKRYRPHVELMLAILPVALAAAYGLKHLYHQPPLVEKVSVALVQPNVPQNVKWAEGAEEAIYEKLERLTLEAMEEDPALVIWPETAVPESLRYSKTAFDLVKRLVAKRGIPLLVGTMDYEVEEGQRRISNSSMLIGSEGQVLGRYDKQHLIPFGEYMPLPFVRAVTPIELDLTAGRESTRFSLPFTSPFSTLICFEDIVPSLAAKAVNNGARWLVNQTNDGWFDPSGQSEQHLAHAVFRCIENRVPMVRCCNTGVSCGISAYGQVERGVPVLTEGSMLVEVYPRTIGMEKTFYTQYGDLFARSCLVFALGAGAFFSVRRGKK